MPEILTLTTPHFDLSVWTKEIDRAQVLLEKTHKARKADVPVTSIRFNPALLITQITSQDTLPLPVGPLSTLVLPEALFFENKQYTFEFLFNDAVNSSVDPVIIHRLNSVEEAFHYKKSRLSGSINFGNDIGWFRLGVRYLANGREVTQYLSFEVLPTKMAMAKDLEKIHSDVDALYPLWRFSLAQKTDQELAKSRKPHERFPLLWLAHFESLRRALADGVQQICRTPHTRLMPYTKKISAEKLRGRLPAKLEECVTEHLHNGEYQHRYQINAKRLSVNTPENQFVKMVLNKSILELTRFKERVEREEKTPDKGRISTSFLNELSEWKKPLEQLLNRPFFADVASFEGMSAESLVLQQRAGYAAVYRIWQELKLYLDLFGQHAAISMKSIAELYEVWCLLEVRCMLLTLGFIETKKDRAILKNKGLEKSLTNGMGAAFHFSRADGVEIRLAHEPVFSRTNDPAFGKIYSWTTVQKPDIFLEATFANGGKIQWIFDAKYRINTDKYRLNTDRDDIDGAPDDAINQMHRYRDALIYIHKADDDHPEKSRPVLGAFVLYPGCFDEENACNPYAAAIDAVAIGAFPLLPGQANLWLQEFLTTHLGDANKTYTIPERDHYLVQDSARIATTGMYLEQYKDLTLVAPLGNLAGRESGYLERFTLGTAGWYHMPLNTTDKKNIARNALREVRYCAIAHNQSITHLYGVKSVRLIKRSEMTLEQAGKIDLANETQYWLFELTHPRAMPENMGFPVLPHFKFLLTNAADVLTAQNWEALPRRYSLLK